MLRLMIRLGVPTVLVCVVAAAGLAGTYAITKGPIAATDKANEEKALKAVLPDAASFEKLADSMVAPVLNDKLIGLMAKAAGETPVTAVYEAKGASGSVGWAVKTTPRGYGGPITMVVGLDSSGKVTGVSIVSNNETPGLGSQAVGPDESSVAFLGKFKGATDADAVAKLDSITGATKSSRGVKKGVEAALLVYEQVLKGLEGGGSK